MTQALSSAERLSMSEIVAYLYESDEGDKELVLDCNGEYARRLLEHGYREMPLTAALQSAHPVGSEGEAVAVIGKDWSLLWATQGSLTKIVERTGIGIGTSLYPQSALDAARAQERAEIVAWLRDEAVDLAPHNEQHRVALDHAADAIATLQHKEADHGCQ